MDSDDLYEAARRIEQSAASCYVQTSEAELMRQIARAQGAVLRGLAELASAQAARPAS